MEKQYDLIVIGAGPGGYAAAIRAAQSGLHTALVEKDHVGGTCLNRGCIPTKTLVHASRLYRELGECEELGITVGQCSYDIKKMYQRKDAVTQQLRTGVEYLLEANRVDVIRGTAVITGNHSVMVQGEEPQGLIADNLLIATGSLPLVPPIKGIHLPGVVTSNELLDQDGTDYQSLVIIGGGVIGVEFATVFNALGCQVTIVEAMDRLLPGIDKEISQNLNMILKKRGINICTSSSVTRLEQTASGLVCCFDQKGEGQKREAEAVLVSTGRRANLQGLFAAGMEVLTDGGIVVDEHFATSVPGIYAIGDAVCGAVQLAHAASAQAYNAVAHICGKEAGIDLSVIPSCIYTDPEIAVVGMDAAMAKEQGIPVKTGKYNMSGNGKSMIEKQERGFIKVIFDAETEVILGAQLMCARATDLISELSTAIVNRLTITQLASVIRPHPTFTEGVTEAAEDAVGIAVHIAPKRK